MITYYTQAYQGKYTRTKKPPWSHMWEGLLKAGIKVEALFYRPKRGWFCVVNAVHIVGTNFKYYRTLLHCTWADENAGVLTEPYTGSRSSWDVIISGMPEWLQDKFYQKDIYPKDTIRSVAHWRDLLRQTDPRNATSTSIVYEEKKKISVEYRTCVYSGRLSLSQQPRWAHVWNALVVGNVKVEILFYIRRRTLAKSSWVCVTAIYNKLGEFKGRSLLHCEWKGTRTGIRQIRNEPQGTVIISSYSDPYKPIVDAMPEDIQDKFYHIPEGVQVAKELEFETKIQARNSYKKHLLEKTRDLTRAKHLEEKLRRRRLGKKSEYEMRKNCVGC